MKTIYTTSNILQAMAYRGGYPIELTSDAAYLTTGNVVWVAPLEPVTR